MKMIGLPFAASSTRVDVRRDQRPPREHAEVDGLEVGEERVVALDRHHRLPRLDPVAVVERVDGQRVPVVGAELEDRDRLVHPAEHRVVLLEDLHDDARVAPVGEQRGARVVEVRVRVVALPHLLDGEVEDLRREPPTLGSGAERHASSRARGTPASAASATSSCAGRGLGGREPVLELVARPRKRLRDGVLGVPHHPARRPRSPRRPRRRARRARATPRSAAGARAAASPRPRR